MGFFDDLGKGVSSAFNSVEHYVEDKVAPAVSSGAKAVYSEVKPIGNQLYKDAKSVVVTAHDDVKAIAKEADKDAHAVAGGAKDLLAGLELPLILIGGAIVFTMLSK